MSSTSFRDICANEMPIKWPLREAGWHAVSAANDFDEEASAGMHIAYLQI